jgi:hypothetical protein
MSIRIAPTRDARSDFRCDDGDATSPGALRMKIMPTVSWVLEDGFIPTPQAMSVDFSG